jgi:hypothetical protein
MSVSSSRSATEASKISQVPADDIMKSLTTFQNQLTEKRPEAMALFHPGLCK